MSTLWPTAGAEIHVEEHFDVSQAELWAAITDPDRLSAWLGGRCLIESRVGGTVLFELPHDELVAAGTVRSFEPPRPSHRVAMVEHTFVEADLPQLTSICRWAAISNPESGSDLRFTHDGLGEADRDKITQTWLRHLGQAVVLPNVARQATPLEVATERLRAARAVLLVSYIGPEVPVTLAGAGFEVVAKTGPGPNDWAFCHARDHELVTEARPSPPPHVDLVHLDIDHDFDRYVELAAQLGASTIWYHSARTRPPEPADNRGAWVPAAQSNRQRELVEAQGMTYIDDHYIADVARLVSPSTTP